MRGREHRWRGTGLDSDHRPLLVTGTALALIALGWGAVAWLALTRWREPNVILFAAATVLAAVLAVVAVINTARLVLRLRQLELDPVAHKLCVPW
jgi:hypothetical protein